MHTIALVLFIGAGLAVVYAVYLGERWREDAIRALAIRSGFHYLGNALPRSLTLYGTPFERTSKVWNVIDGEPHGIRIIAFDCQVGSGKGSWRRSVITVESGADSSRAAFDPDLAIQHVGKWKILYRAKASIEFRISGLMPIEELEAYVDSAGRGSIVGG
jgi:hypothetical protein